MGALLGLSSITVEARSAPSVSWSVSSGQPFKVHDPVVALVSVTLALTVPAAPSPSLKTPVKSLPSQVEPTTLATVVLVVDVVLVLVVVVVVVFESTAWRLSVKINTMAAKIPSDLSARLTD
jgi:hypothetical protein